MSKISQLKWQCRRGTKELDFILNNYLERYYQNASQSEQSAFKQLIELDDPILYELLLGKSLVNNTAQQNLILQLRKFPN